MVLYYDTTDQMRTPRCVVAVRVMRMRMIWILKVLPRMSRIG